MHCGGGGGRKVTYTARRHPRTPGGLRSSPETPEARTDPAADFGPLYGSLQLGNTPRLWLPEVGCSWEKEILEPFLVVEEPFLGLTPLKTQQG